MPDKFEIMQYLILGKNNQNFSIGRAMEYVSFYALCYLMMQVNYIYDHWDESKTMYENHSDSIKKMYK